MKKCIAIIVDGIKRIPEELRVEFTDQRRVLLIAGNNGNGKSSFIDGAEMALGGKTSIPPKPIHDGKDRARAVVEFDDITVERVFTAKDSYLKVTTKDGAAYPKPQQILDKLFSRMSFDPLEFSNMKPAEQGSVLCDLIGLDTGSFDTEYAKIFADRRAVNRNRDEAKAALKSMTFHDDAPDKEISVTEVAEALRRAEKHNRRCEEAQELVSRTQSEVKRLEAELRAAKERHAEAMKEAKEVGSPVETDHLREKLANAESENQKVRENQAYKSQKGRLDEYSAESDTLSKRLDEIKAEKANAIRNAKYPVDGLSIAEDGTVLLNGHPFEQASTAERIRVSVAIGIALNSDVRLFFIRQGSLLDEDALQILHEMAVKHEAQFLVERVGTADKVAYVLEEGRFARTPEESAS
ncbi:MAG: AAA family ATPase [Phycisphaerales bacterium JB065]